MSDETMTSTEPTRPGKKQPKRWIETIEVPMTLEEKAAMGPQIHSARMEVKVLEEQKKAHADTFKARIELAEGQVDLLSLRAERGMKDMEVTVEERHDVRREEVDIVRVDTDAKLRSRPMTANEREAARQPPLPGLDGVMTASIEEITTAKPRKADRGICGAEVDGRVCTAPPHEGGSHVLSDTIVDPQAVLDAAGDTETKGKKTRAKKEN